MIGCVQGKILEINDGKVLILTAMGIGYEIYFSREDKVATGENILFYTSNIIKETSNELYGFLSIREKRIFELLISVKGVGPKSAFSMVNTLGPNEIVQAIVMDNKKALSSAPGIGKKAASQIVLDLSDKISKFSDGQLFNSPGGLFESQDESSVSSSMKSNNFLDETVMACKELGFKENDILSLAREIMKSNDITSSEQLIHQVLREL